jgi:hypothetical protein
MANTLTYLIPTVYAALDIVSRERTGMIGAVSRDASADQAAVNQSIRAHVVPAIAGADITPAATGPDPSDRTIGTQEVLISKSRNATFHWSGEDYLRLGGRISTVNRDSFAQAFRTLANEIEVDLVALYAGFSRAIGTAATTPFATTLGGAADALRILEENGAPGSDLRLVVGTAAAANLRALGQLTKVSEAGDDALLRRGMIGDILGLGVGVSGQLGSHTKGTGSGYLVDLVAGYAVGTTTIHVDTGTGTILAGDVVTFAGDANKYLVTTGFAGDGDGDIVIAAPGLKQTLANDVAMTIGGTYAKNAAFHRGAIILATRLPAVPEGGDSADDAIVVTDPISGLAFRVAVYRQFHRVAMEVSIAWGVKLVKPEHTAILLG